MIIDKLRVIPDKTIQIGGSKSISNRLLVLKYLLHDIEITNLSEAQDTALLHRALYTKETTIDIHHAGTAMRFLTAFFAIKEGSTVFLTGSERMKQRPIHPLVTALRSLGAEIEYMEKEGFPPLKIIGKKITKNQVRTSSDISSQFITALMLIGAKLPNGLNIELMGDIISRPYIEMTGELLKKLNVETHFSGNRIAIKPHATQDFRQTSLIEVESDWSSASYFYSLAALSRERIHLKSFNKNSLQGDSKIAEIYDKYFGVRTLFKEKEAVISLVPEKAHLFPKKIILDMNNYPDIAQTLCVTATAMKIPFKITGLSTLKVKETDRLVALRNELLKIGAETVITKNSIESVSFFEPRKKQSISTYNDHRMAMSFAPIALICPIEIENESVVEKSYPTFWKNFFEITEKFQF